jgi:HK97 family phage prohead protease
VTEREAAEQRIKTLLQGVDLELSPREELEAEVTNLARERASSGEPAGIRRKFVEAPAETEVTGQFTALVSDFDVDRENERFDRHGFDDAIRLLKESGRALPVLFGHNSSSITNVIGMVPANQVWVDDTGLHMSGWIDVNDEVGRKVHRLLASGALAWSIGWRPGATKREGNIRVLSERELCEVSAVPVPANPRTATTSLKDFSPADLSRDQLRTWAEAAGVIPPSKPMSPASLKAQTDRLLRELGMDAESKRRAAEQRKRADELALEVALGEPLDAERQREREARKLRREADLLAMQVATGDFSLKLGTEPDDFDLMPEVQRPSPPQSFSRPTPKASEATRNLFASLIEGTKG